eukprot:gnl/Hemi2/5830_TR2018_c0_g1_i1.p1 gnl/Hemi2/5830_TR2018_c0_g1~~gnl/Hemi2/5830_TR2018_c0_g1_i1.p1  ORF type:complete len:449 (-),score=68.75 gnl/Hemi2/5830_TR2018_c0_g1_i1:137-1435(-)
MAAPSAPGRLPPGYLPFSINPMDMPPPMRSTSPRRDRHRMRSSSPRHRHRSSSPYRDNYSLPQYRGTLGAGAPLPAMPSSSGRHRSASPRSRHARAPSEYSDVSRYSHRHRSPSVGGYDSDDYRDLSPFNPRDPPRRSSRSGRTRSLHDKRLYRWSYVPLEQLDDFRRAKIMRRFERMDRRIGDYRDPVTTDRTLGTQLTSSEYRLIQDLPPSLPVSDETVRMLAGLISATNAKIRSRRRHHVHAQRRLRQYTNYVAHELHQLAEHLERARSIQDHYIRTAATAPAAKGAPPAGAAPPAKAAPGAAPAKGAAPGAPGIPTIAAKAGPVAAAAAGAAASPAKGAAGGLGGTLAGMGANAAKAGVGAAGKAATAGVSKGVAGGLGGLGGGLGSLGKSAANTATKSAVNSATKAATGAASKAVSPAAKGVPPKKK